MEPMQKAINWKRLNISRLDSASTLLLLLLSPQSGKMSLYPKWAGAVPAGDPRGENPVLKSSDRPGSRGTDRRKDNNRFKNRSLQHKYCSSINTFLFRWGQFCNFLLAKKKLRKSLQENNRFQSLPGRWGRGGGWPHYTFTLGADLRTMRRPRPLYRAPIPSYASQWLTGSILHFNDNLLLSGRSSCSFRWWRGWKLWSVIKGLLMIDNFLGKNPFVCRLITGQEDMA